MEEWKEYKLEEIGTIVGGATPSTKEPHNYDGNISWITPKDLSNNSGRYISRGERMITSEGYNSCSCKMLPKGSVLFSSRAPIGYVAIASNELCTNQGFKSIIPDEQFVDSTFLYYLLVYNKVLIEGLGSGTTFKEVSGNVMKNVVVKIPCLEIQRQIASVLSSLDDKIEVNRRINDNFYFAFLEVMLIWLLPSLENDNLEQQAQALFKSWFVDFEPFRDQPFVESELGMIPEGWRIYSMDELVDVIGGYSYKGEELKESQTAMATIKNFERDGGFKTTGFKEIIPSSKVKPEHFLSKFDIIIAHTDLTQNADIIGNPALLLSFGNYKKLIMSMDLVKTKPKNDAISFGLLYSIFADTRFKSHALGYVNGTTVLHLSKKAIPEYRISLPDNLNELALYGSIFDSIFRKESEMMDESRRLAELRDTLLPRLMSGEIKVGDVTL